MTGVILADMLDEPVQDLETSEIQCERRDLIARGQCGVGLAPQILASGSSVVRSVSITRRNQPSQVVPPVREAATLSAICCAFCASTSSFVALELVGS